MVKKSDFVIEKENISSESEEEHNPDDKNEVQETAVIPELNNNEKPKRKYKFTKARSDALAKGREMRKQKIQTNKDKLKELESIKEKNNLIKLAEKVKQINNKQKNIEVDPDEDVKTLTKKMKKQKIESSSSDDSDQQIIVKRRRKKKKKKKKIIYIESSESDDDDFLHRNQNKQVKFNYHDRYF